MSKTSQTQTHTQTQTYTRPTLEFCIPVKHVSATNCKVRLRLIFVSYNLYHVHVVPKYKIWFAG